MGQYGQGQQGPIPPTAPGAFGPPPQAFAPGGPPPTAFAPGGPPPQAFAPGGPPPQPFTPGGPPPLHAHAPGPEFLAADKRFGVVVDSAGVAFDADGQGAEFPWHQLSTVQFRPSPVGHRLMVAAVLPDGRFFECVVNARKASVLQQWLGELAYVTGHYLAARGYPNSTP
ncbi:hypothetical protein ACH4SP_22335 [Streptomyces sp. NPDC021093]|uniref:hypothetical protein n=1 Tax=Streptomyces sp. NPDC021093 TaxID=3365112 RepID=UPI0037882812